MLVVALASVRRDGVAVGAGARIATRSCDERPLAGAGVNLKSLSDKPLPASEAASLGSEFAGVNDATGSKLRAIAGAAFVVGGPGKAGLSMRPGGATAASSLASFRLASLNTTDELPVRESI